MYAAGCVGSAAELGGTKRMFGIKYEQYYSGMMCSWNIQQDIAKVKLLDNTHCDKYNYSFKIF